MSLKQLLFSTQGRLRRKTYWIFSFSITGIALLFLLLDIQLGTYDYQEKSGLLSSIFYLLAFIPIILVLIKRCHDRDRAGWFVLLFFVPILNLWPWLELSFWLGTEGTNKYGPDPRIADYYTAPTA